MQLRQTHSRRRFPSLALWAAINALLGAQVAAAAPPEPDRVAEAIALERAVNELATTSPNSRKVLRDVVRDLPARRHDFIETDLARFLGRLPEPGVEFKCSAAFLRDRARRELLRIKDVLLDSNPQPAHPGFCFSEPTAIDAARPARPIDIYGYDFDREPIQVLLMNDTGFRDVTFAVEINRHYHLTIDLEKHNVRLSTPDRRIAISVGHLIRYSIPVIQPDTKLCSSRIEQIETGKAMSYTPPAIERGNDLRRGRTEFLVNASIDLDSNVIEGTLCMTAVAANGTRAGVSGCAVEYLYTTDSDRTFDLVFGNRQAAASTTHNVEMRRNQRGEGPVIEWVMEPATGASPTSPKITARFGTVRAVSTEGGNCVAPSAFAEAVRNGSVNAATRRRLDSQLRAIDPKIVSARPQFWP